MDTAAARLRREQGADRALARPRPARLRDHAALRGDLDAGAARGRRRAWRANFRTATSRPTPTRTRRRSRASRSCFPRRRAISTSTRGPGCSGRARSSAIAFICRRARSPRSPRAGPSPRSARRRICSSAPACSIRRGSGQARGADRARDRRRRGHQLFDAAHGGRGLQGAAAQRPVVAGARGLLPHDARQRPGAQPRRPHRLDRSRARRPTSSCSIRARRRRSRIGWRRRAAISRSSCSPCSRSATIAPCARPMSRASRGRAEAAF